MKTAVSAGIATAVIYLATPDTMTRIQTLLFLLTIFGCTAYFIAWVDEQIRRIRRKRQSLIIRKRQRREDKIIDFRMRSRAKYIPAFPVLEKKAVGKNG